MKLFFTTALFTLFSWVVSAQEIDQRLLERYTTAEINEIQNNSPEKYNMLVYALDHACYIADLPEGKQADLKTIQLSSLQDLNYISLGLEIEASNQYYRIQGENKMLVVKSTWVLNNELNNLK